VRFILTGGERADCKEAVGLLEGLSGAAVLGDKGYDAEYIVEAALAMGAEVVIPPKSNRKNPREYDKILYKERNKVERMFGKLKQFRRVATRYDKLTVSYMGFVLLAATCVWLK